MLKYPFCLLYLFGQAWTLQPSLFWQYKPILKLTLPQSLLRMTGLRLPKTPYLPRRRSLSRIFWLGRFFAMLPSGIVVESFSWLLPSTFYPFPLQTIPPLNSLETRKKIKEDTNKLLSLIQKKMNKLMIGRSQELAEKQVLAQEEANGLTKKMIKLQTCLCQSQVLLEDIRVLSMKPNGFADEEAKEIIMVIKRSVKNHWLNQSWKVSSGLAYSIFSSWTTFGMNDNWLIIFYLVFDLNLSSFSHFTTLIDFAYLLSKLIDPFFFLWCPFFFTFTHFLFSCHYFDIFCFSHVQLSSRTPLIEIVFKSSTFLCCGFLNKMGNKIHGAWFEHCDCLTIKKR